MLEISLNRRALNVGMAKQQGHEGRWEYARLKITDHCRHLLLRKESVITSGVCVCRWPSVKLNSVKKPVDTWTYLLAIAIPVH